MTGVQDLLGRAATSTLVRLAITACGENHDGHRRVVLLDGLQQIEPAHTRHDHVAEDDGRQVEHDFLKGLFAVSGDVDVEAEIPAANQLLESDALRRIVFRDQDRIGHLASLYAARLRARSPHCANYRTSP